MASFFWREESVEHSNVRENRSLGIFCQTVVRQVWSSLATLTLLTLLAVALHHKHVFDWTEGLFRRLVLETSASRRLDDFSIPRHSDPGKTVNVLMVSPWLRISDLEMGSDRLPGSPAAQKGDREGVVGRVGGVRPIDRCKFAGLIKEQLTPQVRLLQNRQYLKVVGLDVDIAPVLEEEADQDCSRHMVEAISELRNYVTVVAIVMSRESEALRRARNAFYGPHGVRCTTKKEPLSKSPPYPLYLASPRVFHDVHSYPIDFPFEAKHDFLQRHGSWPPEKDSMFPSLSNLLLATAFRSSPAYEKSKTMLCDQAVSPLGEQVLLEDRIAGSLPDKCLDPKSGDDCLRFDQDRYETRAINWRLLETEDIRTISWSQRDQWAGAKENNDVFSAAALILGVDSGTGLDKFLGATITADPIPGAALHALQAVSMQDESRVLYLQSLGAVLADFLVGLAFLLAWKTLSLLIDWSKPGPDTRQMLRIVMPVVLAVLFGQLCLQHLAPWLLDKNIWANPIYLLAGLVLHTYVEGVESGHEETQAEHARGPDFTFGAGDMWDRWRVRRRWDLQLSDAGVCTAAKLLALGYACKSLLRFEGSSDPFVAGTALWPESGLVHWGGWAVFILLVAIAFAFVKRPK